MRTCIITATVSVNGTVIETKVWVDVDIMKTSHTRGWCTRRFKALRAQHGYGVPVVVYWESYDGNNRFTGTLSGSGNINVKRGMFED